jgi:cell division protein FtsZ
MLMGGGGRGAQVPGLVNVDFADVRAVMADAGSSLMGIGLGSGKNR